MTLRRYRSNALVTTIAIAARRRSRRSHSEAAMPRRTAAVAIKATLIHACGVGIWCPQSESLGVGFEFGAVATTIAEAAPVAIEIRNSIDASLRIR
jgi:hypothetical protein